MKVGEKLRKIREIKGISQEYLATQLNIQPQAYGKIERGETKLDFDRLEIIAKLMKVDPLDIVNFDENNIFNNTFNNHTEHQKNFIIHNEELINPIFEKTLGLLQEEISQLRSSNQLLIQLLEKFISK